MGINIKHKVKGFYKSYALQGRTLRKAGVPTKLRSGPTLITKRVVFTFAVLALVTTSFVLLTRSSGNKTDAAWFDYSWQNRQRLTFTNSGSQINADRKVKFEINTATLVSNGKLQSNCADIRFTDVTGKLLDYFIDTAQGDCNTASTHFYVKLSKIISGDQSIYVYYGNPGAESVQKNDFFADTTLGEGLVGYWPMEDNVSGNGQTIYDYAGVNNGTTSDANATGMDCTVSGKVGNACDFDGVDDYVNTQLALSTIQSAFTACVWGQYDQVTGGYAWLVGEDSGGTNTDHFLLGKSGTAGTTHYRFNSFTGSGVNNVLPIDDGGWHQLCYSYDGAVGNYYFDGTDTGATNNGTANFANSGTLQIGRRNFASENWGGLIDEVRIYSRALTATEVSQIYNAGSGSTINVPLTFTPNSTSTASEETGPGPVLYLSFDEGQGTTAHDKSGKGNNGTITGATWQTEDKCISGKCLYFDGNDDIVTITSSDFDYEADESFSIGMWFKSAGTGETRPRLLTHRGADVTDRYEIYLDDPSGSQIRVDVCGDNTCGTVEDQVTSLTQQWVYITAVRDVEQDQVRLYKNGKLVGTATDFSVGKVYMSDAVLILGAYGSSTSNFNGFIDEVKIYPFALTAAQVKADYTAKGGGAKGVTAYVNDDKYKSLNDGLVGYWPMEDNVSGDAQTITDASGNGNNGTTVDGANDTGMDCSVSGKFGTACEFDGADDSVEFTGLLYPNLNENYQMTTSVWVKVDSDTTTRFILGDINGGRGDTLVSATNRAQCRGWDTSEHVITGTTDLDDGSWHHIVCVSDRTSTNYTKMYVDGNLEGEMAYSSTRGYAGEYVKLADGTSGGKYPLSGALDEVRIYNRALTPTEVQNLYEWAPGPVAHYTMDDGVQGTGQTIIDSSGNGNNGTTSSANGTGMDCTVQGQYGGACEFDGVDDYIDLTTSDDAIPVGGETHSVSVWAKFNSIGGTIVEQPIISWGNPSSNSLRMLFLRYGHLARAYYSNDFESAFSINPSNWYHITWVFNGNGSYDKLYIDGLEVDSDTVNNVNTDGINYYIGRYPSGGALGSHFDGALDDVRIYNYALTPKQIRNIMNARPVDATAVGSPLGSPIAHYTFDEGYGTTAYDSVGGYNGTFGGATNPAWVGGKFGKALDFTATTGNDGSRVSYTGDDLDIGTTTGDELTLSMWLKPDTSQTNDYTSFFIRNGWGADMNYSLFLREPSGNNYKLAMGYYDGGGWQSLISTNRIIETGGWSHLTVKIVQGTSVSYYIDGQLQETIGWEGNNSVASASYFNIGGHTGTTGQSYDGLIDDVRIYNYALTPDEIAQDYNQSSRLVLGSGSTESDGSSASNSSDRTYCVPGDTATCNPPVFEMTFDQQKVSGAGQTIYDTGAPPAGGGNNGTTSDANATGMDCTVAGKVGNACEFDGVDDYVTFPSNGMVASAGTISMWLKPEPNIEYRIFHNKYDSNEAITLSTTSNGNRFNFNTERNNISYIVYDSNFQTNQWNFISAIWEGDGAGDDDVISLYVNGVLVDSDSSVNVANQIASTSTLGTINTAANSFYPGKLDQVRIYDYARTSAQIAWEYNGGAPVAWYKFDECQGTTIYDWSENATGTSNGNHGTLNIGATGTQTSAGTCDSGTSSQAWNNGTTGKWGSAMSFDGTDDYVEISDNAILDIDSDMSVAMWVKIDSTSGRVFLHKGDLTDQGVALAYGFNGNGFMFIAYNGENAPYDLQHASDTGQWHHLVGVVESGVRKLYVDGEYISASSNGTESWNNNDPLRIGSGGWGYYMDGMADDVRIYNYALTPEQVKSVYNDGAVNFR